VIAVLDLRGTGGICASTSHKVQVTLLSQSAEQTEAVQMPNTTGRMLPVGQWAILSSPQSPSANFQIHPA
ncbi:MAG: hypothetical protein Q7R22_000515, partial [Verrucomicrobiota bacterium JB025]|nr:hypothetical protein [Verrucomicrobiota bacterium JB025]